MSGIKDYSTTPASNIALFPENMAASAVNDNMRQVQADVRSWYEDAQWVNLGHTPTRTGNTTFTVSGDKTTDYTATRRIKCTDSSTIYGTIVSSSYSNPNTTVTIHSDSGNLSASLTAVFLSTQTPTNTSIHANYGRKGSDIASASTVDLSAATGDFVDVTGTTTITALGTMAAGILRTIRFTGALTLTHNATSLILPGSANITTADGDTATFRSLGSGNWKCITYSKANGFAIVSYSKGADIASASTTDLSTATGDFVDITGTTTITAFGTANAGVQRTIRFTGALTLTYNATSLIIPGSANITTANGDMAIVRSLGSGNWQVVSYTKRDGTVLVGAPFIDSTALVRGSGDATKLLRLEVDGLTTATTRVWTVPDRNIDIGKSTAWEFISSAVASNSASIDFTSLVGSSYSAFILVGEGIVPQTDNVIMRFTASTGGSFLTSYGWASFNVAASGVGSTGSASDTSMRAVPTENLGNSTDENASFELLVFNPGQTSKTKKVCWRGAMKSASPLEIDFHGGGSINTTGAIDGLRVIMSSGNITSGSFFLYGLRSAA